MYKIVFKDKTTYEGNNNYFDTGWTSVPNKEISSIFYFLPLGDCLVLSGYEKYYHCVEATKDINGQNAGKVQLECVYLIGKKDKKVVIYKIGLKENKLIERIDLSEDSNFVKGLNNQGWK